MGDLHNIKMVVLSLWLMSLYVCFRMCIGVLIFVHIDIGKCTVLLFTMLSCLVLICNLTQFK